MSLEVHRGEAAPSRVSTPVYPSLIEASGHNGATFYEHIYWIDNLEGKATTTATAEEGFWSVAAATAAQESIRSGQPVNIAELLERSGVQV